MDERVLGQVGGREPQQCAVTGLPLAGKHSVKLYIGGTGFYVSVISHHLAEYTAEVDATIRAYVAGLFNKSKKTIKKESEE